MNSEAQDAIEDALSMLDSAIWICDDRGDDNFLASILKDARAKLDLALEVKGSV